MYANALGERSALSAPSGRTRMETKVGSTGFEPVFGELRE
jgi:hypothetical protein